MLLVSSLRHFFDYTCNKLFDNSSENMRRRGQASEGSCGFRCDSSSCVNFRIQFGSLAFQLTFDAMKRSKTLIISTSRTLRLVVRHPKGLLLHFLLLLFPHFCSALRFSPNTRFFFELAFFCLCLPALLLNVIFLFFCFSLLVCFFEKNKKCVNWWFCVVLRAPRSEIEGKAKGEPRKTLKGIMRRIRARAGDWMEFHSEPLSLGMQFRRWPKHQRTLICRLNK